jgi:hypothetical protein
MIYKAIDLINIRKNKWNELHDIEFDKKLRNAIADKIINSEALRKEIKDNPELLIEMVFVVVDKEQKTSPFFLNDVQREFIDILNKAKDDYNKGLIADISLLVLKGRQQGFTTLITAYQEACSITNKNFQGFTLADKADNAEAIFQNKAKFPYSQLPEPLKPTEKFNNKRQLLFEKINSSWAVDTATANVGRSRTVNFFHGSECAFWKDGIAPIQAALGEAFTKNCIKIYESTANGFNDYEKMWNSGVHINCFFEWWKTKEYNIKFASDEIKTPFLKNIDNKTDWINTRLKWLRDVKKLTPEQLYWYYNKYLNYIDKDLIKQEYPCTPHEAFLMSGKCIFDTELIINRLSIIPKPIKTGYFIYDEEQARLGKMTNIKWVNDRNGFIKIYANPNTPKVTRYCIGGDTAGEGSDYFTGHVLDARTGKQVAVLRHQMDADLYAKQMYCLGCYYSSRDNKGLLHRALIGIECNFDSFPIKELERLGYMEQYVRQEEDTYTGKLTKKFGFRTDRNSRPRVISNLVEIVRECISNINDKDTLEEMLTFVKNEKGRPEAQEGSHDDLVMGLAIAYDIKDQVLFDEETITVEKAFNFSVEAPEKEDWGEELTPV